MPSLSTVYRALDNFFFPPRFAEFGEYFKIAPNVITKRAIAKFEPILRQRVKDHACALYTQSRWPIDRRRIVMPSSFKLYLKLPVDGSLAPIPMIATLAWKIEAYRPLRLRHNEQFHLESFAAAMAKLPDTVREAMAGLLENIDE